MTAIGIVGPGKAGVSLGFALSRAGHKVFLHGRQARNLPVPLELTWGGTPPWLSAVGVVCLAVSDGAIESCPSELARSRHVERRHAVLHLSGIHDRRPARSGRGRGDPRRHLSALPEPVREHYRALSRAALELTDLPEDRRRLIAAAVR